MVKVQSPITQMEAKNLKHTIMERINRMIEINANGHLQKIVFCYKVVKHEVYNGNGIKAYQSFKVINNN